MTTCPSHDAPACRRPATETRAACGAGAATPFAYAQTTYLSRAFASPLAEPNHLYCAACGFDWIEEDQRIVAQAWWSAGAEAQNVWCGRQAEKARSNA